MLFCQSHLKNSHSCDKIIKEFFQKGVDSRVQVCDNFRQTDRDRTVLFLRDYNYEY